MTTVNGLRGENKNNSANSGSIQKRSDTKPLPDREKRWWDRIIDYGTQTYMAMCEQCKIWKQKRMSFSEPTESLSYQRKVNEPFICNNELLESEEQELERGTKLWTTLAHNKQKAGCPKTEQITEQM